MSHARPAQAVTSRRIPPDTTPPDTTPPDTIPSQAIQIPWWGYAVGERPGRLPCGVTARAATSPVSTRLLSAWLRAGGVLRSVADRGFARAARRGDRGDVPGWVLVTLMTAGLVLVLWGVARDRLTEVFNHAIDGVTGGVR